MKFKVGDKVEYYDATFDKDYVFRIKRIDSFGYHLCNGWTVNERNIKLVKDKTKAEQENYFMRQAREELESVQALLEDMTGRDALMVAKATKAKLKKELRRGLEENASMVLNYFNGFKYEEPKDKPSKISLSGIGKALLWTSAALVGASSILYFVL
jgi:hypothetical protein